MTRMLPVTVDGVRLFLHILAATIWVGGQLTLAGLVPVLRAAGTDVPRQAARQFARIAWVAFAVLILTGIWNIGATSHQDSSASGYSATLGIKMGFVVLSGLAAWWHQRAKSRVALAVGGAAAGIFALLTLFLGVVLAEH
jgi:putative copper export protein